MPISDQTINDIKARADILEVVEDFVPLKKVGSNYRALSPFTNEKTPSFYVSPSKEIYKCFSSGKGGDAISFVMEIEGIGYIEALKYLAQKYGIEIEEEEQTDEQIATQNERDALFIILNFAKEYFTERLWQHEEGKSIGLSYFKERAFSEATIRKFDLGYSLDQWDGFMKAAAAKGYKPEIMEKAGLVSGGDDKTYDRFRGRVMFPIHNVAGKVIAFAARTLGKDKKQPKYINSPETAVYHKSDIVYGIHQARQAIRNAGLCYLVEGYTDVISMHQSGVENVVASSGTSLTKEQIQLIARFTKKITVLYDGDPAGIKASFRGIDLILEQNLDVQAVVFPEGEDPDSFARSMSSEVFRNYLEEQSQDFITFKTHVLTEGGKKTDPASKVQVIRDVIESIALIPDGTKRSVYVQFCAQQLQIDEQSLFSELNKLLLTKKNKERQKQKWAKEAQAAEAKLAEVDEPEEPREVKAATYYVEERMLALIVNYGNEPYDEEQIVADFVISETSDVKIENEVIAQAFELCSASLSKNQKVDVDQLLDPRNAKLSRLVTGLMEIKHFISDGWWERNGIMTRHESDNLQKTVFDDVLTFKYKKLEQILSDMQEALKTAGDEAEADELQRIFFHYKKMHTEVSARLGIVINK